ncbi:hypothetical protein ASPSYDRAFT_824081 [Aspergillus sydowii CBS 593.65]|uniref:Uncharacterized protein n=1 Tax=Aspergillus sydowii CBS 593.65 TaxID=1036612 RepID=A0A1L9TPG3_9EURO|nr:uncharacterized protein ASPSYDRAFT_824081 [Aspergillus sydowii CBS 593.65]OJJ61329.1 hypothetical protein ASPSYDRAFT_824081 [Aspergillus sydowii CBS 593.65]
MLLAAPRSRLSRTLYQAANLLSVVDSKLRSKSPFKNRTWVWHDTGLQKHVRDSLSLRHRDLSNSPERAMPHLLAWKQTILENDLSIHHTPGNTRATSLRFRLSDPTDILSGMRKLATSGQLSVQAAHLMPSQPKGLLGIRQFRVKLADRGIWMSSCGNKHVRILLLSVFDRCGLRVVNRTVSVHPVGWQAARMSSFNFIM